MDLRSEIKTIGLSFKLFSLRIQVTGIVVSGRPWPRKRNGRHPEPEGRLHPAKVKKGDMIHKFSVSRLSPWQDTPRARYSPSNQDTGVWRVFDVSSFPFQGPQAERPTGSTRRLESEVTTTSGHDSDEVKTSRMADMSGMSLHNTRHKTSPNIPRELEATTVIVRASARYGTGVQ